MADTTDYNVTLDQIGDNIDRAKSLAEAENAEGLAELNKETETLISGLPSRGKAPNDQTWAKTKQELRNNFRAAAQVQDKAPVKAKAKSTEVAAVDPADYSIYKGVTELIADGAGRVAEGVKLHLKTSTLAHDVAAIMLDMWRRIPNKDGNPDIMGDSNAAKEAAKALYRMAGEGFDKNFENEDALEKLRRSVQSKRSDVRAKFLRNLDADPAEAELFAKMLESKPEDVPVSQFIADAYDTSLKGHGELARERYQAKQEAIARGEKPAAELRAADDETTPDERIQSAVKRMKSDVAKISVDDFEAATGEAKEATRKELEEVYEAVKKMLAATL